MARSAPRHAPRRPRLRAHSAVARENDRSPEGSGRNLRLRPVSQGIRQERKRPTTLPPGASTAAQPCREDKELIGPCGCPGGSGKEEEAIYLFLLL